MRFLSLNVATCRHSFRNHVLDHIVSYFFETRMLVIKGFALACIVRDRVKRIGNWAKARTASISTFFCDIFGNMDYFSRKR